MTKVLTVGVFDMLHYGHFELFRKARSAGGKRPHLIVAVQEDDVVRNYKPRAKLVYGWDVRSKMVAELRSVDEVIPYRNVLDLVMDTDFDVFAVGEDQTHTGFKQAVEFCKQQNRKVVRIPRTKGISTTLLRQRTGRMA